jgi:hypothetical protein
MAPTRPEATRRLQVLAPTELVEQARRKAGRHLSTSDLVRLGLATLAGVDVEPYTLRPGRPRKAQQTAPETEQIAS